MADSDQSLRDHLVRLLEGRQGHIDVEGVLGRVELQDLSQKPDGVPWTFWELFEHIRIAQWDILEFSRDPKHKSPEFPKGYWPKEPAPADEAAWEQSVAAFRRDLAAMKALVLDPDTDLHAPIPHGDGQTVLREAMLIADHNAYHLGQMVLLLKMLDRWSS